MQTVSSLKAQNSNSLVQ